MSNTKTNMYLSCADRTVALMHQQVEMSVSQQQHRVAAQQQQNVIMMYFTMITDHLHSGPLIRMIDCQ